MRFNYNFNYFDPYYTIDGVSRGFGISYASSDYAALNLASFSTDQLSLNTTYGYRLSETEGPSFNLGLSNTKIDEGFGPVQEIKSKQQSGSYLLPRVVIRRRWFLWGCL